jgi:hypothetical protein
MIPSWQGCSGMEQSLAQGTACSGHSRVTEVWLAPAIGQFPEQATWTLPFAAVSGFLELSAFLTVSVLVQP